MNRVLTISFAFVFVATAFVVAPPQSDAQTIFLPSFRNFTYRGAVKVPDGGTVNLGGVTSSSEGATARGVPGIGNVPGLGRGFGNRGIGRDQSSGNITASAEILIMEELEAQHLAAAGIVPGQMAENADVLAKAAFLSKHVGRTELQPQSFRERQFQERKPGESWRR